MNLLFSELPGNPTEKRGSHTDTNVSGLCLCFSPLGVFLLLWAWFILLIIIFLQNLIIHIFHMSNINALSSGLHAPEHSTTNSMIFLCVFFGNSMNYCFFLMLCKTLNKLLHISAWYFSRFQFFNSLVLVCNIFYALRRQLRTTFKNKI